MAISEEMLVTLDRVLARPYFANKVSEGARIITLKKFRDGSMVVRRDPSIVGVGDDYEDDGVIGAAITAQADFIVSGDKGMLAIGEYRGVRIISAREFLDVLGLLEA
jgi:predicted nucleic acid-binding protein